MKTKSTVRPREIQRTVLNLERSELGLNRVEDAIIRLLDGRHLRRGRQGQHSSLCKAKCVALRVRPVSAPSTPSLIDAVHLARVQYVVRKAPVQFPKEFARTDGIVIAQRRHSQQQVCKWLQVMTVNRRLADLLQAPLAVNVRARHSQENTQR